MKILSITDKELQRVRRNVQQVFNENDIYFLRNVILHPNKFGHWFRFVTSKKNRRKRTFIAKKIQEFFPECNFSAGTRHLNSSKGGGWINLASEFIPSKEIWEFLFGESLEFESHKTKAMEKISEKNIFYYPDGIFSKDGKDISGVYSYQTGITGKTFTSFTQWSSEERSKIKSNGRDMGSFDIKRSHFSIALISMGLKPKDYDVWEGSTGKEKDCKKICLNFIMNSFYKNPDMSTSQRKNQAIFSCKDSGYSEEMVIASYNAILSFINNIPGFLNHCTGSATFQTKEALLINECRNRLLKRGINCFTIYDQIYFEKSQRNNKLAKATIEEVMIEQGLQDLEWSSDDSSLSLPSSFPLILGCTFFSEVKSFIQETKSIVKRIFDFVSLESIELDEDCLDWSEKLISRQLC